MKYFVVLFISAVIAFEVTSAYVANELDTRWNEYKQDYQKTFINSEEEQRHKEIFSNNLVLIEDNNAKYKQGQSTNLLEVNPCTDLIGGDNQSILRPVSLISQLLKCKINILTKIPQKILGIFKI